MFPNELYHIENYAWIGWIQTVDIGGNSQNCTDLLTLHF